MLRGVVIVAALLAARPAACADTDWKAGFGTALITPERLMWMSGYGSRTAPAEGKETELWAKAMALEASDGKRLVLVTLDLVGIDRDTSKKTCALIMEKYKLPRDAVALDVSHTHCGPVLGMNLRAMYSFDEAQVRFVDDYTSQLPGRILKAVDAAMASLAPAKVSQGVGRAGFAVNRRENKEAEVPTLRAEGRLKGPTDHEVPVLAVHDPAGKLRGIVFGYACHATVLSYQKWCGDYPGFAMIELEAAHPGATAMFFAGCGADQNPIPRRTVELAKGYGKQLAVAVEGVLAGTMTPIAPEFTALYREIDLPLDELPNREALLKDSESTNKFIAGRARMLLKKHEKEGSLPPTYPYPVQTWRLGKDVTIVILGGEVVVDFSLRLKKEFGPGLWVMGYANDVMAYIPSARVLKEGGYEGATSMIYYGLPSPWGPRIEELIVAEVERQVKQVRGK